MVMVARSPMLGASPGPMPMSPPMRTPRPNKRIVLIRHGRTFMNERLAAPGSRWGDPGFTDVFDDDDAHFFRDSPLSPAGERQARRLAARLGGEAFGGDEPPADEEREALRDVGLVVCSPLTRACQTAELALLPRLGRGVPAVALPLASERLYLVSDLGRPSSEMTRSFPWIDFGPCADREGEGDGPSSWWYVHPDGEEYAEWRPTGEGQTYACWGEPEEPFARRMEALHDWLGARPERTIALVCHWGVLDWLTGEDFANCEMRVVGFDQLRRTGAGKETEKPDEGA